MKIKQLILLFAIASLLLGCSDKEQPATQANKTKEAQSPKPAIQAQAVETQPPVTPTPQKKQTLSKESTDDSMEQIEQEVKELADTILTESDIDMPRKELEQEIMKMVDEMESQKTH